MHTRSKTVIAALAAMVLIAAGCGTSTTVGTGSVSQDAKWVKVVSVSGSGGNVSKKTKPFALEGGEQKLVGKLAGDKQFGSGSWWVEDVTDSLNFEFIDVGEPGRVDSRLYLGEGRYYVNCNTCNSKWNVTLYELR